MPTPPKIIAKADGSGINWTCNSVPVIFQPSVPKVELRLKPEGKIVALKSATVKFELDPKVISV